MLRLSAIDLFRKVPLDLTQPTRRGGLLSLAVGTVISLVLLCEVWTYMSGETKSHIVLDANSEAKLDINFEMSFYELPCRFANIEVWDYLGNSKLDISKQIRKTVITGEHGEEQKHDYHHRGIPATEKVAHNDEMKDYPEQVRSLDSGTYGKYLKENEYTFVMFYVDWCMFCQMAKPVWSKFAKHLPAVRPNIRVAQVDCVKEARLCEASKISGYPTFMMFKGVNPLDEDYHGARTVDAFTAFAEKVAATPPEEHDLKYQWHEGCLMRGHLTVNRVPGNFHVTAKSDAHNFDQKSTNTSHIIHHLSFGKELEDDLWMRIPEDVRMNISPLDDLMFINHHGHMSHEHYIKVVSTKYEVGSWRTKEILGYQVRFENRLPSPRSCLRRKGQRY